MLHGATTRLPPAAQCFEFACCPAPARLCDESMQDRIKAAKEHAAAAAGSTAAQHVTATDIPAMDTAAADDSAAVVGAGPVTDAAEGPVVVTTDVLSESDAAGALHHHKPVEEVAAAVALVGDKRTAETDAAEIECVPSKRMAE